MEKLSIVVPTYNQQDTIVKDIKRIKGVIDQTRWGNCEIIVVNDGSSDNTLKKLEKLNENKVYVYSYEKNMGKGYAVKFGFSKSKCNLVAFIDSGMDIDPNGISLLLEHMTWYNADVIVGSKRHPASKIKYSKQRRLYSFVYQIFVYVLFRLKVKDTQVGLKVYKREVIDCILPFLKVNGFAFDIEMLAVANYCGYNKIYEAPVKLSVDFTKTSLKRFVFTDKLVMNMVIDTLGTFYRMYFKRSYTCAKKG